MRLATWLRRPIVWLPISIGLLALLVWRSRLWEAGAALSGLDPRPLAAGALVSIVIALLWAIRSADLLAAAGRPVGVMALVPMTTFANTINNLTPGSAGEIVRMYLLRAHHGVDYATSGAVVFVERIGAIGYLASSALLVWLTWLGLLPMAVAIVIAITLVAAPAILYRLGLRPLGVIRRIPLGRVVGTDRWGRLGRWLSRVDDTVAGLVGDPRHLVTFVALSGGIFLAYDLQLVLVGQALGVAIDPLAGWGALGLATTVGVLSLLPFGLGSTDLALVALLGAAGLPTVQAVEVTLGYRLVSTLPLSLAGIASFAWLSARLPASGMGGAARAVRDELGDALPDFAVDP
ncbi:MAG TPA: lysylphosphatidylglycerol synthase transmembrane domain-containing protein [Candidatus Limnocylindrales bacterium]|nr:lysylphosphatidylglycerol synthase transmembrane domain-containing protein [Candidatus Limnocylindrales bacterium]